MSKESTLALCVIALTVPALAEASNGYSQDEQFATFEDKILGIQFQYPSSWENRKNDSVSLFPISVKL